MSQEENIESILALEKQIEEGRGDIIKLKRARNSLLNISTRIPPEILGQIFASAVTMMDSIYAEELFKGDFAGVEKGSYNFLLVCHHWYEVASNTPELWSFWGNTLPDWEASCRRTGRAAPIDLVLDGFATPPDGAISVTLKDALRDHADRDKIRKIHLMCRPYNTPANRILSSLTGNGDPRKLGIESINLWIMEDTGPDTVSDFFAHSRLPKLRHLRIDGTIQPLFLGHLDSQTTRLTTLWLRLLGPSTSPPSALLSILASNPGLQELTLFEAALPDEFDESKDKVRLPQLRSIDLAGSFHSILGLLDNLELSAGLDCMDLIMKGCEVKDVLQTLGPYLQDHFQRDTRYQQGIGIFIAADYRINFTVNLASDSNQGMDFYPERTRPSTKFAVSLTRKPSGPEMDKLCLGLMGFLPREHVVSFDSLWWEAPPELFVEMPNLETLSYRGLACLSDGFLRSDPNGPHPSTKLFPSLRCLRLNTGRVGESGWEPLVRFLAQQKSNGRPVSFHLSLDSHLDLSWEDVKTIRGLAVEFSYCVRSQGRRIVSGTREEFEHWMSW